MVRIEQEIPVNVHQNGEILKATLVRDLKDSLNDVIIYPGQNPPDRSTEGQPAKNQAPAK